MHRPYLVTCLSLFSLTAFAFNPTASGWYGETAISPTISFADYQGTGASLYSSGYDGVVPGRGEFNLLGAQLKQRAGWREWFCLEFEGAYARSLGANANEIGDDVSYIDAMPANMSLWDAAASAFTSISLDRTRTVFIEPAIGFSLVVANMQAAIINLPMHHWESLKFYGPTCGLYMRLVSTSKMALRFGGGYMASRLQMKKYASGVYGDYSEGDFLGKIDYRSRRHGLSALVHFDYSWKSWVGFHVGIDYHSWSAGGSPQLLGPTDDNQQTAAAPMLSRARFVWGADFTY